MGKVFFKARRTINEIRRDSGIEGALRDIERESYKVKQAATDAGNEVQKAAEIPDWRQSLDHAAGPGAEEGPEEAETSPEPPKNPDSEAINEEDPPPTETDSQQSVEKDLGNS